MELSCNFCGKSRTNAFKLIKSNNYAICDECIRSCNELLTQEVHKNIKQDKTVLAHTNPITIKKYLDQYVIGQDKAKVSLSVGVANHYKRMLYPTKLKLDKSNLLILGPTGTGKTWLVKNIANYLNVPVAIADATSLTEAGYIGDDVESVLTRLISAADGNIVAAQNGIVFIDEIDKISKKNKISSNSHDAVGEGVQAALLKMIEGNIIKVPLGNSKKQANIPQVDIDTTGILFIVGGAFEGLSDIINTRTNATNMGFEGNLPAEKHRNFESALPEDLIQFGMIPEFIGRFPIIINTNELTKMDLIKILVEPKNNLVQQYEFYFDVDDIKIEFTQGALEAIADQAIKLKTGARGLRSIIENVLLEHNYSLNEYKAKGIHKIIFTEDVFTKKAEPELIINPNFIDLSNQ